MMSSPLNSPSSQRSSNQQQLPQEMERLSQELYQQAQGRSWPQQANQVQSQSQASATPSHKKHSFLTRRETLPAKRFSSYEPSKDASSRNDLPCLASASRKSMSSPQIPALLEQKPRPEEKLGEKVDIRSRIDRRLSLQPWQIKNPDKFVPKEPDSPDDTPDLSFKFDSPSPDKKKSIWSWKPLRALSHIGRQRFHCVFSAYVNAVEGLPPAMNGLRLCVHMRKEETKEGAVQTMPSRVFQGIAEFEETLFMKCTLYGSKSPSNGIKFMSKAFIVSVIAPDVEEIDLGKHQIDLSRLHADSMDERIGELKKGSSWNTALELSGKAKGGKLIISFDYEIIDKDSATSDNFSSRFRESRAHQSAVRTSYSLPNSAHGTPQYMRAYSNHSPSISEPGDEYDALRAMEHLILKDPFSMESASEAEAMEVQGSPTLGSKSDGLSATSCDASHASPNFEPTLNNATHSNQGMASSKPKQSVRNADYGRDTKNTVQAREDDDASTEHEAEFVVVDQGIEIGKLIKYSTNDRNVGGRALGDDLDNSISPLLEELDFNKELEPTPVQEKGIRDCTKDSTNSVEVMGSGFAESEIYEGGKERAVIWQHGDKKVTVTYQMIMQTLDSLLEGATAKEEQHQEEICEENKVQEQKAGDNVSGEDDTTYKKVMHFASAQCINEEPDNIVTKVPQGMVLDVTKQQELHDNLDQEVDLVAGKFLDMLETSGNPLRQNSVSEPDSPRAQLLKQFEQEALLEGGFGLNLSLSDRA